MSELELLLRGGVVGGGGAGFPLWKKLSAPAEQLLINGAECEPLLKSDQYLMLHCAADLAAAAARLSARSSTVAVTSGSSSLTALRLTPTIPVWKARRAIRATSLRRAISRDWNFRDFRSNFWRRLRNAESRLF